MVLPANVRFASNSGHRVRREQLSLACGPRSEAKKAKVSKKSKRQEEQAKK